MFNPTVQLKSGGYIVIGVTEALVAIDVNSGRATKEGSIEETATKTNLEAAEEVARQLRLRDLAGLIVIDFIDMDDRKNNAAVEKRMKDKLKTDRARIQVGRISGFGLMEMSRQRLRPGMIEATTQPCPACHGTGLIRSDDNMALSILRQIEEEGVRGRSREVLVKCPVAIANFLMNQKREHVAQIEQRYGLSVRVEGDPHLVSPDFALEKFKTASRAVPVAMSPVVSVDTSLMDQVDADDADADEDQADEVATDIETERDSDNGNGNGEAKPKRKRRRRRRSKSGRSGQGNGEDSGASDDGDDAATETVEQPVTASAETAEPVAQDVAQEASAPVGEDSAPAETEKTPAKPRTRTRSTTSRSKSSTSKAKPVDAGQVAAEATAGTGDAVAVADDAKAEDAEAKPKPKRTRAPRASTRSSAAKKTDEAAEPAKTPKPKPEVKQEPAKESAQPEMKKVDAVPQAAEVAEAAPAPKVAADKPKRRGWWSLGS
jgi:ribonuclease E